VCTLVTVGAEDVRLAAGAKRGESGEHVPAVRHQRDRTAVVRDRIGQGEACAVLRRARTDVTGDPRGEEPVKRRGSGLQAGDRALFAQVRVDQLHGDRWAGAREIRCSATSIASVPPMLWARHLTDAVLATLGAGARSGEEREGSKASRRGPGDRVNSEPGAGRLPRERIDEGAGGNGGHRIRSFAPCWVLRMTGLQGPSRRVGDSGRDGHALVLEWSSGCCRLGLA